MRIDFVTKITIFDLVNEIKAVPPDQSQSTHLFIIFYSIRPPPGLLPLLGPLERYMMPTLDAYLLVSSRAGADLGRMPANFYYLTRVKTGILYLKNRLRFNIPLNI